jgi:hypothetical protein
MVQVKGVVCVPYESLTADSAHHSLRRLVSLQVAFSFLGSRLDDGGSGQSDIDSEIGS